MNTENIRKAVEESAKIFGAEGYEIEEFRCASDPDSFDAVKIKGKNIVIFPEGTRSKDKTMKKFKETFAILSKELNIPIIPVAIAGSESACYSGSIIPKFCKKIDIEVLDPVMPTPDQSVESLRDKVASLIEKHLKK